MKKIFVNCLYRKNDNGIFKCILLQFINRKNVIIDYTNTIYNKTFDTHKELYLKILDIAKENNYIIPYHDDANARLYDINFIDIDSFKREGLYKADKYYIEI